jgi:hypothetical protein
MNRPRYRAGRPLLDLRKPRSRTNKMLQQKSAAWAPPRCSVIKPYEGAGRADVLAVTKTRFLKVVHTRLPDVRKASETRGRSPRFLELMGYTARNDLREGVKRAWS